LPLFLVGPDFGQIIHELDKIIVKSAIRDPNGINFWLNNFPTSVRHPSRPRLHRSHIPPYIKQYKVSWDSFVAQFFTYMRVPLPIDPDPSFNGKPSYIYFGVNEDDIRTYYKTIIPFANLIILLQPTSI